MFQSSGNCFTEPYTSKSTGVPHQKSDEIMILRVKWNTILLTSWGGWNLTIKAKALSTVVLALSCLNNRHYLELRVYTLYIFSGLWFSLSPLSFFLAQKLKSFKERTIQVSSLNLFVGKSEWHKLAHSMHQGPQEDTNDCSPAALRRLSFHPLGSFHR